MDWAFAVGALCRCMAGAARLVVPRFREPKKVNLLLRDPRRERIGPVQWPSISQAWGRITATWSVMFRALDGPFPMLIIVMPPQSGATRWKAGICGMRSGGEPIDAELP
jgi:hypothetical protein